MASQFAAITNKKLKNQKLSNKLFPKYMKKVTKFSLEALTGKALSVWPEFIDETSEKVFCLQMQIKFNTLLY